MLASMMNSFFMIMMNSKWLGWAIYNR